MPTRSPRPEPGARAVPATRPDALALSFRELRLLLPNKVARHVNRATRKANSDQKYKSE